MFPLLSLDIPWTLASSGGSVQYIRGEVNSCIDVYCWYGYHRVKDLDAWDPREGQSLSQVTLRETIKLSPGECAVIHGVLQSLRECWKLFHYLLIIFLGCLTTTLPHGQWLIVFQRALLFSSLSMNPNGSKPWENRASQPHTQEAKSFGWGTGRQPSRVVSLKRPERLLTRNWYMPQVPTLTILRILIFKVLNIASH